LFVSATILVNKVEYNIQKFWRTGQAHWWCVEKHIGNDVLLC